LTAVSDVLRGVLPGERSGWARVIDALLVLLAVGLACSITLSETTLLVLAGVLLARARPDTGWLRAPLLAPVLALAAWTLLSAAVALNPAESLRSTRSLLTLATFWVVQAALPDATAARRFATAIFVAVSVVACLSIVQVAGCVEGGFENTPQIPLLATYFRKCVRAHGFFSIYMTLAGVLLVVVTLTLPRLRGFGRPVLAAFAWLAGVVALALTEVRGAWIGFGGCCYCSRRCRWRRWRPPTCRNGCIRCSIRAIRPRASASSCSTWARGSSVSIRCSASAPRR
jgi:hypothetical protein